MPREGSRIRQCLGGNLDFILSSEELLKGLSQEEAGYELTGRVCN